MDKYYFHIGDYRRKTAHLTNEEHGIYRWLIDEYFLTEKPISTDLRFIMRKLRLTSDQKDDLEQILHEFFILEDDGWYHRHVEQVMARVHAKSVQSKNAINTRWEKERKIRKSNEKDTDVIRTNNESDTDVIPTNNQKPKAKSQKRENGRFTPPSAFEVQTYLDQKNIKAFTGETFVSHYSSVGWMRGKNKIKNWKQCVATWVSRRSGDDEAEKFGAGSI